MKYLPNNISNVLGRQLLVLQKNSPNILFGLGIVGVVGTAVLASKATMKVEYVLDKTQQDLADIEEIKNQNRSDYSENDYIKDKTYVYVKSTVELTKLYAPAVACGVFTIASLTKSHNILNARNASMTAAYATLEHTFNKYRKSVSEAFGDEKEQEVYRKVQVESATKDKNQIETVKQNVKTSTYARWFDDSSSSWNKESEYNLLFLKAQQNYANDLLVSRGHLFLNEVYDMLDIKRSRAGSVVGWILTKNGSTDNYVDFGIFDNDRQTARDFVNGWENQILLDFNVDGVIYDKI